MHRRVAVLLAILLTSCVWTFESLEVAPLARHAGDSVAVISPVKAHLADGSTVVFPDGVDVVRGTLRGDGMRYSLTLRDSAAVGSLPLDSVVGMEVFRTRVDVGTSIVVSVLATSAAAAGAAALAVAIFGSCPTYYVDSAGTYLLEGEGFSYSIAPLFEARDVDRLRIHTAPDGTVRLEVRNEALETHYLNHLELLEVEHAAGETIVGDEANRLLIVDGLTVPTRAVDRDGRDVRRDVAAADGEVYRSDPRVVARARLDDLEDWIDVALPAPMGADSVAIVLRLRNSLLNTILLYDIMLGDPGARSLDWVGRDLQQVGPAVELAQWYQRRMGLDVTVFDGNGGGYRFITHIKDTGPIAWKDVSVVVPVLERGQARVRLRFPVDNWRVDRIAVAGRFRRAVPLIHPLAEVRDADGKADRTALASLVAADAHYLETTAGQRFTAGFAVPSTASAGRTFFLASQGYYTEWVRRDWLAAPRGSSTFVPSDAALLDAIGRWRATQETLEARFMASRIPVR
jgi:hypothetical protein